jgi:hypothetical protein
MASPKKPSSDAEPSQSQPSSLGSLFGLVAGLPRAIYDSGAKHGREWIQRDSFDDNEDDKTRYRRRRFREIAHERAAMREVKARETEPLSGGDLVSMILQQLDRGEREAQAAYNHWKELQSRTMASMEEGELAGTSATDHSSKERTESPMKELRDEILIAPLKTLFDWDDETPDYDPLIQRPSVYANVSRYSPLMLELEPGFDSSWRIRFEDLIRAQKGEEPLSKAQQEEFTKQSQGSWLSLFDTRTASDDLQASRTRSLLPRSEQSECRSRGPAMQASILANVAGVEFRRMMERQESIRSEVFGDDARSIENRVKVVTWEDGSGGPKTVVTETHYVNGKEQSTTTVTNHEEKLPALTKPRVLEASAAWDNDESSGKQPPKQKSRGWFWSG